MDEKKIEKTERGKLIIRALMYAALGAYILLAGDAAVATLHIVVGVVVFAESLEEFIVELIEKSYRTENDSLYHPLAFMIISILIIVAGRQSVAVLCVIWGVVAIIDSARELNEAICEKTKLWHILKFLRSGAAIVFAIMLVLDPFEHVHFHMMLLAAEYFLESVLIFDRAFECKLTD